MNLDDIQRYTTHLRNPKASIMSASTAQTVDTAVETVDTAVDNTTIVVAVVTRVLDDAEIVDLPVATSTKHMEEALVESTVIQVAESVKVAENVDEAKSVKTFTTIAEFAKHSWADLAAMPEKPDVVGDAGAPFVDPHAKKILKRAVQSEKKRTNATREPDREPIRKPVQTSTLRVSPNAGNTFVKKVTSPVRLSGWTGEVPMRFPPREPRMWSDELAADGNPIGWYRVPIHPNNFFIANTATNAEYNMYSVFGDRVDRNAQSRDQEINCVARIGVALLFIVKTAEELLTDKYPDVPEKVFAFLCTSSHEPQVNTFGKSIVRSLYYPTMDKPISLETAVRFMQKPINALPEDFLKFSSDMFKEHLALAMSEDIGLLETDYKEPTLAEYEAIVVDETARLNEALESLRTRRQ